MQLSRGAQTDGNLIQILIVEDDKQLQMTYMLLLEGEPGMAVVGAFTTGEDALAFLKTADADIMLTDLGLPGMSGIELIKAVKRLKPAVEIMALTVFEDRENTFSAIKAGASGYLLKGTTPRELIEALYTLHQGGAPMSPKIARAVLNEFRNEHTSDAYLLTPREKDILKGMERGHTYKELAQMLHISPHTVHSHIKHIYEKLQACNRKEAFLKARKMGIL